MIGGYAWTLLEITCYLSFMFFFLFPAVPTQVRPVQPQVRLVAQDILSAPLPSARDEKMQKSLRRRQPGPVVHPVPMEEGLHQVQRLKWWWSITSTSVNSTRRCYIVNHAYTVSCGEDDENKRGISAKISHWRRKWGTRCLRIHLGAVSGDLFKKRFVYLKRNLSRIFFFLLQRYPAYSPPAHQAKGRGKYKIKKVYNPGYQKCPVFTILNLFDKNVRLSLMGLPTFWRFDFGECFFVNKSWPEDGEQEFERHVFFFKLYIYHLSFSTVPCDGQFEFGRLMKMKTLNQTPRDACKMLLEPFLALRANLPEG